MFRRPDVQGCIWSHTMSSAICLRFMSFLAAVLFGTSVALTRASGHRLRHISACRPLEEHNRGIGLTGRLWLRAERRRTRTPNGIGPRRDPSRGTARPVPGVPAHRHTHGYLRNERESIAQKAHRVTYRIGVMLDKGMIFASDFTRPISAASALGRLNHHAEVRAGVTPVWEPPRTGERTPVTWLTSPNKVPPVGLEPTLCGS
jgi:hypothetical protein